MVVLSQYIIVDGMDYNNVKIFIMLLRTAKLKTYEVFASIIFHLIFWTVLNCGLPTLYRRKPKIKGVLCILK